MLKRARDYYFTGRVKERDYNPLWKHIYSSAQASLLSQIGDEKYDPSFYVDERVSDDGITAKDVDEYLHSSPHKLMLIAGPAGVGKTTFLDHVLGSRLSTDSREVVWIDVRDEVDETHHEEVALIEQFKASYLGA